ncbi:MAG: hypothetical protein ABSB90_00900 [Thermoplasmata archaeon]
MNLVPLASVDASALRWLRTAEEPAEYTLSAGDARVAVVRWPAAGGSASSAETAEGRWTLQRRGFLTTHLTLRAEGAPADAARITVHVGLHRGENYHRIEFAGGPRYRFHRAGVQLPAWQVTDDGSVELVHIEPVREGRALQGAAVLVSEAGLAAKELVALLAFTWYFIVLVWFEDETLLPLEQAMSDLELR